MEISLEAVKARLAETKGHWPEVSKGSGVDYFTIVRVANGTSKKPWYDTIKKLAVYFEAKERPEARA